MKYVKSHRRVDMDSSGQATQTENTVLAENILNAGDLPESDVDAVGVALLVGIDGKLRRTTVAALTAWLQKNIQKDYSVNVPYIDDETGHWMTYDATQGGYIDTGVKANGTDGTDGVDGKSAYQLAVEGGYTGTEEEFNKILATGPWLPLSGGNMQGDAVISYGLARLIMNNDKNVQSYGDGSIGIYTYHGAGTFYVEAKMRVLDQIEIVDTQLPLSMTEKMVTTKKYVDDAIQEAISGAIGGAY